MSRSIHELVPAYLRAIEPYRPGKPIEEVERELKIRAVKLASNENPLGPSPLAMEAAKKALAESHRYPDGGGWYLREKIAARLGVAMEQVILGGGSNELIDLLARTLLRPGEEGLVSSGSFPTYYISIAASGAKLVTVPLRNYTNDLGALAAAITPRTKLIFLANPNNPTGTMFTAAEFEKFLARVPEHAVVAADEAYIDYVERADFPRSLDLLRAGSGAPVVVLRTFSKIYGLAGLRIGYGIGPAELIAELNKIRGAFNTSSVAQAAALAALDDAAHVRRSVESNRAGLAQLAEGFEKLGVNYVPSVTNFVLAELGMDPQPLVEELLRLGVIVRPMGWMGFPQAIRVSVGTREENSAFLTALERVLAAKASPSGGRAAVQP